MLYSAELPKFNSQYAFNVATEPDLSFVVDGVTMATRNHSPLRGQYLRSDQPFLSHVEDVSRLGACALAAKEPEAQIEELGALNDKIAEHDDSIYVLLTSSQYVSGFAPKAMVGRLAILRGFIWLPNGRSEVRQVSQALEDRRGAVGRRYDMGFVLFPRSS